MREFLKAELLTLHLKTGLQQYFKLSEMVDAEGLPDGERQIRILIDSMVAACAQFPMIPDDAKQRIIQAAIVQDQDFTGLHSRVIWRWLNGQKDRFIKRAESGEPEKRIEHTPEERAKIDKLLADWKLQLSGAKQEIFKGIEEDMKQIQREDAERQEGKKGASHRAWSIEDETKRELHNQWIRENFDTLTGKKLSTWLPEEEWLQLREVSNEKPQTP